MKQRPLLGRACQIEKGRNFLRGQIDFVFVQFSGQKLLPSLPQDGVLPEFLESPALDSPDTPLRHVQELSDLLLSEQPRLGSVR